MTRVLVAGALANKPQNGGEAWVRLSYLLGFRRLGCEVAFVEQVDQPSPTSIAYFTHVLERFGFRGALVDSSGETLAGAEPAEADLLVNVSGNLRAEAVLGRASRRAYIDIDPGFTQIWHEQGLLPLAGHDVYFTIGENVGRPGCPIPSDGIAWRPTRPPVVLEEWPVAAAGDPDRLTTVSSWRSYGRVGGYGVKLDEYRKLAPLPRRACQRFELALAIDPAEERDLALLREFGWRLVDPRAVAGDPLAFREYVRGSGGEFSVAQGIYAETASGWFSDRTARYLACGKPALVQDTSSPVPAGEGLLTFSGLEEAVEGARLLAADHDRHARAARALAEEHFDSDVILTRLLEEALA